MNRREFIKALVATGAALAVAERVTDLALAVPRAPYLAHIEGRRISSIYVYGLETIPRPVIFNLSRVEGGFLFRNQMNSMAGMFHYILMLGNEIIVSRQHQVVIDADFDGACHITSRGKSQSYHDYFVLRRYEGPDYKGSTPLCPPQQEFFQEVLDKRESDLLECDA